jgi:hypothetical protein
MRNDSLNYFFPFESNSAGENQLTRAFLVLFRYVPAVQVLFYDLVRESLEKSRESNSQAGAEPLPPSFTALEEAPIVLTQKGSFPATGGVLCSVVITDRTWKHQGEVSFADRRAIYDGVIAAGGWTYVVEVKPSSRDIWEGQLNLSKLGVPDPDAFELLSVSAVIEWREIIQRLIGLVSSGILHGAEKTMVDDFRQFVFRKYSFLNPYPTLSSCHRDKHLLNRRCEDILSSVASAAGLTTENGNWLDLPAEVAQRAYLWCEVPAESGESGHIGLGLWPGDNKPQAQRFYERATIEQLEALKANRWQLSPNLIFRQIRRHVGDNQGQGDWKEYFQFWKAGEQRIGRYRAPDTTALLDRLLDEGFLTSTRRSELEFKIGQQVDVTPGMHMNFKWPLAEAESLDDKGDFETLVRDKIAQALAVWGQEHVLAPQPA